MNIERALACPGFMSEIELTYLATLAERCYSIVEVGSWRGRSANAFAVNTPGALLCVDTWADNAYGNAPADITCYPNWLWHDFQRNTAQLPNIETLRMSSVSAATLCSNRKFDLVFIDAGHWYEDVYHDILAWRPLLKEGGILCGHDYNPVHHPPVIQAVNDLVPKFRVVDTIWTTEECE